MEKIVKKGIKIDLHIHSVFSKNKDGNKVAYNTKDNLSVLVQKLISNEVEMCAITDHDNFDYSIYNELKKQEQENNCIKKILPGIEFSVEFDDEKTIHIVTLFDDRDNEKVKKIEEVMHTGKGKTTYQFQKRVYKKNDYFDVLAEIGIDFIMIAHQKTSPLSNNRPHANDVMSLGVEKFNELVFMDYFDALEFRNRKNEIFNKVFTIKNSFEEKLRFITGSDCHNWANYPYTSSDEKSDFKFTFIKSLPTFKGLAMAVTDKHRIEMENSFYNPNEQYLENIDIEIDGEENVVPLSKGINVIIGDNSIGKSLFLYALTSDYKKIDHRLRSGYEKYIKRNNLCFKNYIKEGDIFKFNEQGEIRGIFDQDGLKPDKYLANYYPESINASKYREISERELDKLYAALLDKFEYDKETKELPSFIIPDDDNLEKSITFIENAEKVSTKELQTLVDTFEQIISNLEQLVKKALLDSSDKNAIESSIEMYEIMHEKYVSRLADRKKENDKINVFNTVIKNYKKEYIRKVTDAQAVYSNFLEEKETAIEEIVNLLQKKVKIKKFVFDVQETNIIPETNSVDKYKFVSKLQIEKIDNNYLNDIVHTVIKKGRNISTEEITEFELKELIKNYPCEDDVKPLDVFKDKIRAKLDDDFKIKNTIIEDNMDAYEEVSSGFDAQMYFTLLCGETRNKGIYIIDQPEDNISQKAIKEKVLDEFRKMGVQRQVIMVTHNPQFIVNLDVDNVIYLSKENGKYRIQSGALEYENTQYSILKIVADNIEGGLRTIQGRLKRYEKSV